jgi:hypothetical protein
MTTGYDLLAALNAAPDDAARLALLSAAPRKAREQLKAELIYRSVIDGAAADVARQRAAFDKFSRELDAAPDDDARLRIIAAVQADPKRGPEWLAEYSWQRTATVEDWRKRYVATVCGESAREQL